MDIKNNRKKIALLHYLVKKVINDKDKQNVIISMIEKIDLNDEKFNSLSASLLNSINLQEILQIISEHKVSTLKKNDNQKLEDIRTKLAQF